MDPVITEFLHRAGLGAPSHMEALSGGVSSDIWRIEVAGKRVCVKRALPRLRVAQVWEAPIERNRYERQWMQAAARAVAGSAPKILAWDDAAGLFAMEYLDYPVWKNLLREGKAHPAFATKVGTALASIHSATAGKADVEQAFPTDAIFYAIRLEPYLVASAARHADLADVLQRLVQRTAASKHCLVHGDVSPKNILVAGHGPVFLDAECAWYGDPAFDLAFCLNHMFLKSVWVPAARQGFLDCFMALQSAYLRGVTWEPPAALEERAATLLPGLLLGRVDGKSPVEYLDAAGQSLVRDAARKLLVRGERTLVGLHNAWLEYST
jgi:aminoglycoside phosphotransferase (APT) family kinase protein